MKLSLVKILGILVCMGMSLASCGDDGRFSISGEIVGNPNMNLYIKYYGAGKVQSGIARVQEGKFEISGVSRTPAVIEITGNDGAALGYLYLANGDEAKVVIDRSNPFLLKATGTKLMEEWTAVSNEFAAACADALATGDSHALNEKILGHMQAHPSSVASSLLFATAFDAKSDPEMASSALQALLPEAMAGGILDSYITIGSRYADGEYLLPIDSIPYRAASGVEMKTLRPQGHAATVIAFTQPDAARRQYRTDTILPALKKLCSEKDLQVVDFSISPDTVSWKNQVRSDSAAWIQAWAPGGIFAKGIDRLQLPELPYYIVADSAGSQIYRGASVVAASDTAISLAKKLRKK